MSEAIIGKSLSKKTKQRKKGVRKDLAKKKEIHYGIFKETVGELESQETMELRWLSLISPSIVITFFETAEVMSMNWNLLPSKGTNLNKISA
jgi:hypothetical protein